jgi:CRP-like cAMP-binding protein
MNAPLESLLARMELHMPPDILADVMGRFEEVSYAKNDFFLKQGRVSDWYLLLTSGMMRSFTFDLEGNEVTTWFYPAQGVVFEVSSFFLRLPSTEHIQAIIPCEGLAISFEQLNYLFHTHAEFREFGRKLLVKEFAAFKQRTLALINQPAEARYAHLLQHNPEILQHAQLQHIASFLGITQTSLSRIRREFIHK